VRVGFDVRVEVLSSEKEFVGVTVSRAVGEEVWILVREKVRVDVGSIEAVGILVFVRDKDSVAPDLEIE
jgi:hypothetical protein